MINGFECEMRRCGSCISDYSTEPDGSISDAVFRSKHNKFHYDENVNSLPTNKMRLKNIQIDLICRQLTLL